MTPHPTPLDRAFDALDRAQADQGDNIRRLMAVLEAGEERSRAVLAKLNEERRMG